MTRNRIACSGIELVSVFFFFFQFSFLFGWLWRVWSDEWWASLFAWKQKKKKLNIFSVQECSRILTKYSIILIRYFWWRIPSWACHLLARATIFGHFLCLEFADEFAQMAVSHISYRCFYARILNFRWDVCVCQTMRYQIFDLCCRRNSISKKIDSSCQVSVYGFVCSGIANTMWLLRAPSCHLKEDSDDANA